MYKEYWQLDTKPFEPTGDARFFFGSQSHQAAMHKLRYAIESRRQAVLLAGPAGVGKTLLSQSVGAQLDVSAQPFVHVVFPLMSSRDLLAFLAEQLGAPPVDTPQHTIEESLRRLDCVLCENTQAGRHAVIVVDEAQLLEDSGLFETLRLLLNLQQERRSTFSLLLVGQSALLASLARYQALDDRIDMKIMLRSFTAEETASYVQHRLQASGATREIFSADALEMVYHLCHGTPQRINRLCDLALLVGFASQQHTIDAQQLQNVHNELVTISAAA